MIAPGSEPLPINGTTSPAPAKAVKSRVASKAKSTSVGATNPGNAKSVARKTPVKATAQVTKPAKVATPAPDKDTRAKKPKLVRDSFTIPKDEYAVIEALKQRASLLAQPVKKSELLRAGLKVLASLPDNALRTALQVVPSIKTGRPKAEPAETAKSPPSKAGAKTNRK